MSVKSKFDSQIRKLIKTIRILKKMSALSVRATDYADTSNLTDALKTEVELLVPAIQTAWDDVEAFYASLPS
jgi:hypothetical protein